MSILYEKYCKNQSDASIRVKIANAVSRGEISSKELLDLISELEQNGKLNNSKIEKKERDHWNKAYLNLLTKESVGGTFSKEYLLYLKEVSEFVRKKSQMMHYIKVIAVIALAGFIAGLGLTIIFSKGADRNDRSTDKRIACRSVGYCSIHNG